MKRWPPDLILDLLEQALGPTARVAVDRTGSVRLVLPSGEPTSLVTALWSEDIFDESKEPVLWLLGHPTRRLRQELRDTGRSFMTRDGAVRLQLPGLLVDRSDLKPRWKGASRPSRSPFADRASLIARVLLEEDVGTSWTVTDLAEAAGVSAATASYAVEGLARRSLIESEKVGRRRIVRLRDPRRLLSSWCREYDYLSNESVRAHAPIGSPARFLSRLSGRIGPRRWAATLHAGAALTVPHTNVDLVHTYVEGDSREDLVRLCREQEWVPAEDGKLVLLLPRYRVSVWAGSRELDGIPVVSELQLILDLWHYPLRGRESAELLLERLVGGKASHE